MGRKSRKPGEQSEIRMPRRLNALKDKKHIMLRVNARASLVAL